MDVHLLRNAYKNLVDVNSVRSSDHHSKMGYRVFAANTADGSPTCWYWDTLEQAMRFAECLCESTCQDVEISKYIGTVCRQKTPTEFVPSEDGSDIKLSI